MTTQPNPGESAAGGERTKHNWWRRLFCHHAFKNADLALTGIPELSKPVATDSYAAGEAYYAALNTHPSVTHRVQWPCAKCGTVFYAHCGLDVLAGRGVRFAPTSKDGEGGR